MQRAIKFGLPVPNKGGFNNSEEMLKKQQRAERFGLPMKSQGGKQKVILSPEEEEKMKKRLERFGGVPSGESAEDEEKLKKRLERFGNAKDVDQLPGARIVKRV